MSSQSHDGVILLNGDVCIQKMRHTDYICEKKKYTSHREITKKDKIHKIKKPSEMRIMEFLQVPLANIDAYILVNMDRYFEVDLIRKMECIDQIKKQQSRS